MKELYAEIILPLAHEYFTFRVPDTVSGRIAPGKCVRVKLGVRKIYAGIVYRLTDIRPDYKTIKEIDGIIEELPDVTAEQLDFWKWMAGYYMCTIGEVMRAAYPASLKPSGLSDSEFFGNIYKPARVTAIELAQGLRDESSLNKCFESLAKAKGQYKALLEIAEVIHHKGYDSTIPRAQLRSSISFLNVLRDKGIIDIKDAAAEIEFTSPLPALMPVLTEAQQGALRSLRGEFDKVNTALFHGVTGSGKTEIYITLIEERLRAGENVMMLLPEIAMTSQLVARITSYFGDRVIVYHSGLTPVKRAGAYMRLSRSRGGELLLGVRSAVLLPLPRTGLIIVDEEHDSSYKQNETAPRYHARDCAVMLGRISGAKVLLGSATPSLESYMNARQGKYGYVELNERYGGSELPQVIVSDTLTAVKRGERHGHFNRLLLDEVSRTVGAGKQVILFQNRRGFSPYIECRECGTVAICPDCNVTLTYHKTDNRLVCHYCGYGREYVNRCSACGKEEMAAMGFGTEKIEEEIGRIFPGLRVSRLDRDVAKSVNRTRRIVGQFEKGESDILIGTQMITKGFDFEGVELVGILNADNLLNYPDFRASERAFQLLTQVAGRAGRRQKQGLVMIQTSQPDNAVIRQAAANDYHAMARTQLAERKSFLYPPFCRLIEITLKCADKKLLEEAAGELSRKAREIFGRRLLGPQPPAVDKIRNQYLLCFILKVEKNKSYSKAKRLLNESVRELYSSPHYRAVKVSVNVDPQ